MLLHSAAAYDAQTAVNSLWLLVAAALVLIMTPGVAFFYGGMVRAKSVISMMMMSFGAIAIVAVLWVLYGYGLSFGPASIPHILGTPDWGLTSLMGKDGVSPDLNGLAFAGFQATSGGCSYYPFSGSTLGALGDALEGFERTRSALHFPAHRTLPAALVRRLLRARIAELPGTAAVRPQRRPRRPD